MKRIISVLLTLLMLTALTPVRAEETDYTLEIKGGALSAHTETVDGEDCLKVQVALNGANGDKTLSALMFRLTYDSDQLSAVKYQTVSAVRATVNIGQPGMILYAFASGEGVSLADGKTILTLWFKVADGLTYGTEIPFRLVTSEAQSYADGKTAKRTVGSAFAPFIYDTPIPVEHGTIEWNAEDVRYRGTTPYVIADGSAQTPRFTVKDDDGATVDPAYYTGSFCENTRAGTAYLNLTFQEKYSGTLRAWFKIYLPATKETSVENVETGVRLAWAPVEGAAGYVIYRRAWNLKDNGWTAFERWNNTTETSWTDTNVYAGTRYQYGIKGYFAQRTDPVSGAKIGGNVGDNYNLGMVGPLITTVRITTRTLTGVTGGSKQITVKWSGSKLFTGYQVQLATDAGFSKSVRTVRIAKANAYQTTVKNLSTSTTYYVRVRSYHVFDGTTYYGQWSNTGTAKTD